MSSLELGLVGNSSIGALINAQGEIVWACFPRFDGDAVFCSLLRARQSENDFGFFAVDVADLARTEQEYLTNTPVLVTRLYDRHGGAVEMVDFAPRFLQFGRVFRPMMLVRQIKRLSGSPRVRVCMRPAHSYGAQRRSVTLGSHHLRYIGPDLVLRLTTDGSVTAIAEERWFFLGERLTLLLGPDETIHDAVTEVGRRFHDETVHYWREWVRALSIPFEWQDEVIRAALTLKLNAYDDTGAIIAAMTTSIPEAPWSERNWDYRHCWLRDGYFVVNALNRLGATRTMELYLDYLLNIAADTSARLQPVYRIDGRAELEESVVPSLPGYRDMGPVRIGNLAYSQVQHDVYGSAVVAATHVFFDHRLAQRGGEALFRRLEHLGKSALVAHDQPDAGIWELRGTLRVHTFSAVMCWAACDRLARIAARLGLATDAAHWREAAAQIHRFVCQNAWSEKRGAFVAAVGVEALDASMLLLHELGFLEADDPRFSSTVAAIESELKRGDFIFRYAEADDFGVPANAFVVCTFWYVHALAALGRRDEARNLFQKLLDRRNRHGLLAEHIDPRTGEQWGNFVQTYSMVGLITAVQRLSIPWDRAF